MSAALAGPAGRRAAMFFRRYGIVVGFVLLFIVTSLLSNVFLTPTNLINVLRQVSINGILAVGMTLVIISAGIDLSVGSVLALAGAVAASFMVYGFAVGIGLGLAVGVTLGLLNGLMVTRLAIPPFVATLGMMAAARGMTLAYTGGRPIMPARDELFRAVGAGYVGPIPVPVIIAGLVFLLFHWILSDTRFGRYLIAVGSNEEASLLAGINVARVRLTVYVISGFCAGLAGIVLTSRLYSAGPLAGVAYELDAIAAAVIGGTSLMGGEGRISGTLIGVLIIGVLSNAFNLVGVPAHYQDIFKGFIIVAAVGIDTYSKRRR
jgi:ribose/xylose/arabinose/galactoside ABC-type transport system permease subunit